MFTHRQLTYLDQYIKDTEGTEFELGKRDCFTFTNEAWEAATGKMWAPEWVGKYARKDGKLKTAKTLKRIGKSNSLIEALDKKLKRHEGVPPRGAIVVTNRVADPVLEYALGLAMGDHAIFLWKDGYRKIPIDEIEYSWVK